MKNMSKITYANKQALNENTSIADINKVKASDLNEIKEVVNQNDDNTITNTTEINTIKSNIGNLNNLETTDKTSIVNAINEIDNRFAYSTDEKVIGKWINGKPLYRKIVIGEITSYGTDAYPHISTGLTNVKDILLMEYTLNYGDNYEYYSSIKLQYYIDKNDNNDIIFTSPSNPGIITAVLYYTKTTD